MPSIQQIVDHVIARSKNGVLRLSVDVPVSHTNAIKDVYGRDPKSIAENWKALATEYFDKIRNHKLWLGCDCRPGLTDLPKLTTYEDGTLRRLPQPHPPHAQGCAFYYSAREHSSHCRSFQRPTGPRGYMVRSNFREREVIERVSSQKGTNKRKPATSLQSILWELLHEAGADIVVRDPMQSSVMPSRAAIKEKLTQRIATKFLDYPRSKIPLSDVIEYGVGAKDKLAAKLRQRKWPDEMRPQGFLLGIVKSFRKGSLTISTGKDGKAERHIPMGGKISVFGEHVNKIVFARRPYLALVSVAKLSRNRDWVDPVAAYLHPVVSSQHWMPVDSDHERTTFVCLHTVQERLAAQGFRSEVRKPLHDLNRSPGNGAGVLIPDFHLIVSRSSGSEVIQFLIETMGYKDDWYREDKKRIHEALRGQGLGDVIEYEAYARPDGDGRAAKFDENFVKGVLSRIPGYRAE